MKSFLLHLAGLFYFHFLIQATAVVGENLWDWDEATKSFSDHNGARHKNETSPKASNIQEQRHGASFKSDIQRRLECELNSGGNYGVLAGTSPRYPSYYYQVVFPSGTDQFDVEETLRPSLQRAVVNGFLSSLFVCPSGEPISGVLGVSSNYEDLFSGSAPCLIEKNTDEECFTYQGRPILWTSSEIPNSATAQAIVRPLVHSFMFYHSQELLALDSRIIKIEYMEEQDGQLVRPPDLFVSDAPTKSPTPPPTRSPTPRPTSAPVIPPSPSPTAPPTIRTPVPTFTPTLSGAPSQSASPATTSTAQPTTPGFNSEVRNRGDDTNGDDDESDSWWFWVAVGGGAVVLLSCCVCFFCFCHPCSGRNSASPKTMEHGVGVEGPSSSMRSIDKGINRRATERASGGRRRLGRRKGNKGKQDGDELRTSSRSGEYVPPGGDLFPESAPPRFSVEEDEFDVEQGSNIPEEDELTGDMGSREGGYENEEFYDEEDGNVRYEDGDYEEGYDDEGEEINYHEDDEYDDEADGQVLDNIHSEAIHDYINDDEMDSRMDGGEDAFTQGEDNAEYNDYDDGEEYMEEGEEYAFGQDGYDDIEHQDNGDEYDENGEEYYEEEYYENEEQYHDDDGGEYPYDDGEEGDQDAGGDYDGDGGYSGGDYVDSGYGGVDPSDVGDEEEEEEEEIEYDSEEDADDHTEEYIDETIHSTGTGNHEVSKDWQSSSVV